MIWGRAWKIMQLLGLDRTLRHIVQDQVIDGKGAWDRQLSQKALGAYAIEEPTFGFDFRKSDQTEEGFSFCPLTLPRMFDCYNLCLSSIHDDFQTPYSCFTAHISWTSLWTDYHIT